MNINFKRYILWLLGIASTSAIISDIIYGKAELANEYLIGQFIGQVFSSSISFAFLLCLLWFMFEIFFKKFLIDMCSYHNIHNVDEVKPIHKKKVKKK